MFIVFLLILVSGEETPCEIKGSPNTVSFNSVDLLPMQLMIEGEPPVRDTTNTLTGASQQRFTIFGKLLFPINPRLCSWFPEDIQEKHIKIDFFKRKPLSQGDMPYVSCLMDEFVKIPMLRDYSYKETIEESLLNDYPIIDADQFLLDEFNALLAKAKEIANDPTRHHRRRKKKSIVHQNVNQNTVPDVESNSDCDSYSDCDDYKEASKRDNEFIDANFEDTDIDDEVFGLDHDEFAAQIQEKQDCEASIIDSCTSTNNSNSNRPQKMLSDHQRLHQI